MPYLSGNHTFDNDHGKLKSDKINTWKTVRKVAPINADNHVSMINPLTIKEANFRMTAFKAKEKSPRVSIVNGKVRKKRIGAIDMLSNPMMMAAQKAFLNLSICIPGTMLDITKRPTDEISDVRDQTSI
jgi:hypothetical protein